MLYDRKAKQTDAMQTLISLGLFIPCENLDLYHGRAKLITESVEWRVDEKFNSAGNNTGNRNVYGISTLSAGTFNIAKRFAEARQTTTPNSVSEVVKINAVSKGAVIFNTNFSFKNLGDQKEVFYNALNNICNLTISQGSPIVFEARDIALPLYKILINELVQNNVNFISKEMMEKVIFQTSANPKIVEHIAGAINSKNLLTTNPIVAMNRFALEHDNEKRKQLTCNFNGVQKDCPLNNEWIAKWLSKNNIIGVKSSIDSATLNDSVDAYFLFDISKVNTQKEILITQEKIEKTYSDIGTIGIDVFNNNQKLFEQLKFANPEQVIKLISNSSKKAKERYAESSGVWEGFTIGEHTETVLRIFEESFDLSITENAVPFVKMILALHDIEKNVRRDSNSNNQIAREILNDLNIEANSQDLIIGTIYDLMPNIASYFIQKNPNALSYSQSCCRELLKPYEHLNNKENAVTGLMNIGKIVQTCDGGAYTRYAVTRGPEGYYRNGNDRFTQSFDSVGLINEKLSLKR